MEDAPNLIPEPYAQDLEKTGLSALSHQTISTMSKQTSRTEQFN